MSIKVQRYAPTSSVGTSTNTTTITDIPSEESFDDILVLNQAALKAMTIDAMVAQSSTGSVNPDAVDAAAIMRFRSTLGSHVVAPIPTDDLDLGTPKKAGTKNTAPVINTTPSGNVNISGVFNEGDLECSDELNAYFKEAADLYGLDVKLLKCIGFAESNFTPDIVCSNGATGVMMLMPNACKDYGVTNPLDARENIMGGARILSTMLKRYDGNINLALAAYNAGPGNVDKYGGIPPFKETQNYVEKINKYYYNGKIVNGFIV